MNVLTINEIENFVKQLLDKYNAESALLFGSYARGVADSQSDIDIIVIGGPNFKKYNIFALAEDLRELTKHDVDAFEISEVNVGSPFYKTIMKEGRMIA